MSGDLLGRPGHFRLAPGLDPKGLGELARGHTQTTPCLGCDPPPVAPKAVVVAAVLPPKQAPARALRAVPAPVSAAEIPTPAPVAVPAVPKALRPCVDGALTSRQAILVVLASAPGPMSMSDLAVRAWRRFPHFFSLRGYEREHPNVGAVWSKLSGIDGIVARGWARRPDDSAVEATPLGRAMARRLVGDE